MRSTGTFRSSHRGLWTLSWLWRSSAKKMNSIATTAASRCSCCSANLPVLCPPSTALFQTSFRRKCAATWAAGPCAVPPRPG
uniref:Putative secreted protein n=1 Tax=Ixodes ricinus TaxID=34613 RepID=A0A6B0U2E6_IXORI